MVDLPYLNVVDRAWLAGVLDAASVLAVVENHAPHGGLGATVLAAVAHLGRSLRVAHVAVRGTPVCGRNDEVLAHHGLDAAGVARAVSAVR